MVTLILAEKEEQAKAYAAALGKTITQQNVHIIPQSPFFKDEVHVVAAEGHLFEYGLPSDNWDLAKLPLVNVSFKQQLKQDKKSKDYFNRIYQEVTKADSIIIGTDADREGERIAYSILSHIPGGKEKITKRLWVNSMTTAALQRAFQTLRDPHETYNYYLEAEARAQSDWLVGMNLSPLATLDLQAKGQLSKQKGNSLSVGRVQTPTVRLICENDLAIRGFMSQTYWKLQLEDRATGVLFSNKDKFSDSDEALVTSKAFAEQSLVTAIETKEHQRAAPPLFNLSDLQGYAAKRWQYEATKTEQIVEKLYLKKYLSYPRTDCRFITTDEFTYLTQHLNSYQEAIQCSFEPKYLQPREAYVDDQKVAKTSHYALIPTENIPNLATLSQEERRIYEIVVRRTILMFAADCFYQTTSVQLENKAWTFQATGRHMIDLGWAEYSEQAVRKDIELPHYQVGQLVPTAVQVVEGVTKPPKRLTESQLISQVFPKYGLGTQATRGAIIQTIQKCGYVKKDRKTGQLFPTDKAYLLINYLIDNEFSSPETTGGWEVFLSQIGEGAIDPREFVDAIKDKLATQIQAAKERSD